MRTSFQEVAMFARVAMYDIPADRIDDATESFQQALDEIRGMTGLAGAYLLVSTDSGRAVTMTLWESRAEMEASRVTASRLRSEAAGALGGSVVNADEYEVTVQESG
jgi:heme-degrading monooxygenase HmoA